MFERVERAAAELAAAVAEVDPDAIPADAVVRLFDLFDLAERHAATGKTLLARRVDEVHQWKRAGYPSAAEYLAAKSGSSVATARDVLATSSKLASLPLVEDALRAGKLSGSQAAVVADAAVLAPTQQPRLVNDAQRTSLAELRQECLSVKAAADHDGDATRDRLHRERQLRTFTDREGARNMHIRGPLGTASWPDAAAAIRVMASKAYASRSSQRPSGRARRPWCASCNASHRCGRTRPNAITTTTSRPSTAGPWS